MSSVPGKTLSRAVAAYLGVSEEALQDGLRSGSTLADAATGTGHTVDGLRAALVAAIDAGLYKAVRDGRLDAGRAAALQARSREQADRLIGVGG